MLGKEIKDPENAESNISQINGLGLLNAITFFKPEKNTYQIKARMYNNPSPPECLPDYVIQAGSRAGGRAGNIFNNINCDITGYEIHMGETKLLNGISPFLRIIERSGKGVSMVDGAVSNNGNVIGTYVHGILDNDEFRLGLINYLRENKGISPLLRDELIIAKREKEEQYNRLADLVRKHIKMDMIYKYIN